MNKIDKENIKNRIKEIESKSSAEIVCVIANSADKYRYIIFIYSALLALMMPFLLLLIGKRFDALGMSEIELLFFAFFAFILEYSDIKYKIIPKYIKKHRCKKLAFYQFYKLKVNTTSNHKAILILVCKKEKYIKIVVDSAINKKVPNKIWDKIVKDFIPYAKSDNLYKGILHILDKVEEIYIKNFPRDELSKDELNNDVIEI